MIFLYGKDLDGELPHQFLRQINNNNSAIKGTLHLDNSSISNSSVNGDDGMIFFITSIQPKTNTGANVYRWIWKWTNSVNSN